MKKLLLILLLCVFVYPQQIDTTVVDDEVIITEVPSEIQPVIKKFNIPQVTNQLNKAISHRDYYQRIVDKLEWIVEFEVETIDTTGAEKMSSGSGELIVRTVEYSPKAQVVVNYLGSIENLSLEKIDIQELWKGYTPIQTSTVWRNATIRKWMDLNGVLYKLYWPKARLLEAVAESLR